MYYNINKIKSIYHTTCTPEYGDCTDDEKFVAAGYMYNLCESDHATTTCTEINVHTHVR